MASSDVACSHVAATLFALDAYVRIQQETSSPPLSNSPRSRRCVEPVCDINYSYPNKRRKTTDENTRQPTSVIPPPTAEEMKQFYDGLASSGAKSVILSVLPGYLVSYSREELLNIRQSSLGIFSLTFIDACFTEIVTSGAAVNSSGKSLQIYLHSFNSSVYQSELRCVVVTVGDTVFKVPTLTYINVLRMKISTTLSLKTNYSVIENLIKEKLMSRGFPLGISVGLLSNGSVEAAP
ncbi:hypothetical protein AMECASPLE_013519 [Ameca splendens]|uniref:Uncharacterized protein n=1 Tax=Ameca splendens TaxID=208324 RepID=A0ABV0YD72_9TELE